MAKILMSVLRLIVFLEKRNHIPITANIRKTDRKVNDSDKLVVICSATESVKLSWVVKKGFTALRYLNVGNPTTPEFKIPIPDPINAINTMKELAKQEGVFSGISSGGTTYVALEVAKRIESGLVVSVICDRGDRYISTGLFNE